ncbi:hypothetical protein FB451DRAFT_1167669 [Mycena latifolia]|nr:hypothetical protein FB451DRAFT_1167669 [Mycena latifolia]
MQITETVPPTASIPTQEMNTLLRCKASYLYFLLLPLAFAYLDPAKLPLISAEFAAAASTNAAATAASVAKAAAASAAQDLGAQDPVWVRGTPITPDALAALHPEGTGETWYIVIQGREPGMYHTVDQANELCNGVPHQLKEKKKSRCEVPAWYKMHYDLPNGKGSGIQKWMEA